MFSTPITYTLTLPEHILNMQESWFGENLLLRLGHESLRMSYQSQAFTQPTHLPWQEEGEFLGFFFNLGSDFRCSFPGDDQPFRHFKRHQYTLVYMPDAACTYDFMPGNASVLWLHYPMFFFDIARDHFDFLKELSAAVDAGRPYVVVPDAISAPGEIQRAVHTLLYANFGPNTRDIFYYYGLINLMFTCFEQIDMEHQQFRQRVDHYALDKVRKVKEHVYAHLSEHLTLGDLADEAGVAPRTLSRMFKKNCDESVMDFVHGTRMDKALELLQHSDISIERIGKAVGYRVPSHFTRAFVRRFGVPPRSCRANPS